MHELAHGVVADRLGDPTPRLEGRLTLNPLSHLDPLGALAFVMAGFGWAKPVRVNAAHFRLPRRDMALVAAAGPLSNFALAFLALLMLGVMDVPQDALASVASVLAWTFQFNVALGVFNLMPLPPLDGGHFLPYALPPGAGRALQTLEQYGPLILIVLVLSGATRYVLGPVIDVVAAALLVTVRLLV